MAQNMIVEGFITDLAFVDQSKAINGVLSSATGQVAALSPKALSYFAKPGQYRDSRATNTRVVNWPATTSPQLVVDETAFSVFVGVVNALPAPVNAGFFKIIDRLLFDYDSTTPHATIETFLTTDPQTSVIYVADSLAIATTVLPGQVYAADGTHTSVSVPSFVSFSISILSGQTLETYELTLYASTDAFLTGYNVSSIVSVVPPLPYDKLFSASLINTNDNIFTTATLTAALAYNTTQTILGTTQVSGITEYSAVLVDINNNTATVPFNILYKGRAPTLLDIRSAIKDTLLASGVGTEIGWEARIPGIFVSGRFYIIPFWDQTFQKPNQLLWPRVLGYSDLGISGNKIMASLGHGDVTSYSDLLPVYFNRMTTMAVPDLSGDVDIQHLSTVIPDYQDFPPDEAGFGYMSSQTQQFSSTLNLILAVDFGATNSTIYAPITENLLSFYSFTVGKYEVCVITQLCYNTIMESTQ